MESRGVCSFATTHPEYSDIGYGNSCATCAELRSLTLEFGRHCHRETTVRSPGCSGWASDAEDDEIGFKLLDDLDRPCRKAAEQQLERLHRICVARQAGIRQRELRAVRKITHTCVLGRRFRGHTRSTGLKWWLTKTSVLRLLKNGHPVPSPPKAIECRMIRSAFAKPHTRALNFRSLGDKFGLVVCCGLGESLCIKRSRTSGGNFASKR